MRPKSSVVGEDVLLHGQKDAGGIDEVDQRQAGHLRDGLRPDDLLARHREEGPGLHRGVVGDDHAAAALDHADAGDHARRGGPAVFLVHAFRGPEAEFLEGRAGRNGGGG